MSMTMKKWRARMGYTQPVAANKLNMNLRTLEGNETTNFSNTPIELAMRYVEMMEASNVDSANVVMVRYYKKHPRK